jgi:hypothetical protein
MAYLALQLCPRSWPQSAACPFSQTELANPFCATSAAGPPDICINFGNALHRVTRQPLCLEADTVAYMEVI